MYKTISLINKKFFFLPSLNAASSRLVFMRLVDLPGFKAKLQSYTFRKPSTITPLRTDISTLRNVCS